MNELATIKRPSLALTLANAVQEYLLVRFKGKANRTKQKNRSCLEEFEIFAANKQIDRLLMLQWDELQERRGLMPQTINAKGTMIRSFLLWCEEAGYMKAPPVKAVIKHHVRNHRPLPSIYTQEEYERIKEATIGTNNYFLTVVGYYTGMSMVDICYLRWPCIDMERLFIETNRIKMAWRGHQSSSFMVPFIANSDLHLMLQDMAERRTKRFGNENDDFVHPDLVGLYIYRQKTLVQNYGTMLKKLGIKDKTFKNWRNTFMSHVANSGANMGLAVKLTGHKDPTVYAAYIKPDVEALRTIVQSAFQWAHGKETVKQLRIAKPNQ